MLRPLLLLVVGYVMRDRKKAVGDELIGFFHTFFTEHVCLNSLLPAIDLVLIFTIPYSLFRNSLTNKQLTWLNKAGDHYVYGLCPKVHL